MRYFCYRVSIPYRWDSCPAEERATHKGKEGYCTLSYEVSVDHTKRIIAATKGFKGATNDKTVGENSMPIIRMVTYW